MIYKPFPSPNYPQLSTGRHTHSPMTESLEQIRHNAQNGEGACQDCPAQIDSQGQYVNPGIYNYDADVIFLTLDPSHDPEWEKYDTWQEYNEAHQWKFYTWPGGSRIAQIIAPRTSFQNIWLGDSIKCPVANRLRRLSEPDQEKAAEHCRSYLTREIEEVGPEFIVTIGGDSAERLLEAVYGIDEKRLETQYGLRDGIKPGSRDCGRQFLDLEPPVLISPSWSATVGPGWLDREFKKSPHEGKTRLDVVREAFVEMWDKTTGQPHSNRKPRRSA